MMKLLVLCCVLVATAAESSKEKNENPKQQFQQHPSQLQKDQQKFQQHQSSFQKDQQQQQHPSSLQKEPQSVESAEDDYRQLNGDEVRDLLLRVVEANVDKDQDGQVASEELKQWLAILQEKVIQDNVNRQWAYYKPETEESLSWQKYYPEQKEVVSWQRYLNYTYPDEVLSEGAEQREDLEEVRALVRRAERRWKNADVDADGGLTKEEFRDFIHPEESQRAGGVAVTEAIEDMDLDKDKKVSLQEYMEHLNKVSGEEKEDPNWAAAQQEHFKNYLDRDGDGSLNEAEMREWVVPSYDRSEAEAWRLIALADADQNQHLSKAEIAARHEYFLTLLPPEYWVQEDPTEASKHDEF